MSKYKVFITSIGERFFYTDLLTALRFSNKEHYYGEVKGVSGPIVTDNSIYRNEYQYITENEDLALSVYAKAKRNLNLSIFNVSLDIPKSGYMQGCECRYIEEW